MVVNGAMLRHTFYTLYRVVFGFVLAGFIGVPLGILMGRFRRAERFFVPLVSVLMPIPSLAWVPVFILWFGLGDAATIALVFYAATFPVIFNTWTGVRSVNRLWIRSAEAMGADEKVLFQKVVLPGSLPFIITGLRQAFARAWIAVVGGEMIAATSWGLGWVIFDSKEFLKTDVMLASLAIIGLLGLGFERLIFQTLERRTVARWGMVRAVAG
jgi:NitT/TauT family transport system permease protein